MPTPKGKASSKGGSKPSPSPAAKKVTGQKRPAPASSSPAASSSRQQKPAAAKPSPIDNKKPKKQQAVSSTGAADKHSLEDLSVDDLLSGDWSDDEQFEQDEEEPAARPTKKQKQLPAKDKKQQLQKAQGGKAAATKQQSQSKKHPKPAASSSEDDFDPEDDEDDDAEMLEDLDEDEDEDQSEDEAAAAMDPKLHRKQLEQLKKTQPDFYKYMKSHGQELLEFDDDEDEDEDEDGAEDGSDSDEGPELDMGENEEDMELAPASDDDGDEADPDEPKIPSADVIKQLDRAMRVQGSWRAVTQMLKHFRTACHSFDDRAAGDDRMRSASELEFASSRLFTQVLHLSVRDLPGYIARRAIGGSLPKEKRESVLESIFEPYGTGIDAERAAERSAGGVLSQQKNWAKTLNYAKSFVGNLTHLLDNMPSSSENFGLVLKTMSGAVRIAAAFPGLGERLLKVLIKVWGGSADRAVRVLAFLRLRELTIAGWSGLMATALKQVYLAFVRNSKFVSAQNLGNTVFMANCVVEMYGLDPQLAYQQSFIYIRQLAIHLRNALRAPQKDGQRSVYTWKYLNCLRVWSMVLTQHHEVLKALVYPFVQVCLGTMDLLPSARYFPVRFHVCEWLIPLSRTARCLIPLAPYLTQPITATDFSKQFGRSGSKQLDLKFAVKVADSSLKTLDFREQLLDRSVDLLMRYFTVYSYSYAFSELSLPTLALLKKFVKTVSVGRMKKRLRLLTTRIEANCDWCETRRNQSGLSPKELQVTDAGQWEAPMGSSAAALSPMERYLRTHDAALAKEQPVASAEAKRAAVAKLHEVDEGDENEDASEDDEEAGADLRFASDVDDEDADDSQTAAAHKPSQKRAKQARKTWSAEDVDDEEGLPADTQELLVLSDSDDE